MVLLTKSQAQAFSKSPTNPEISQSVGTEFQEQVSCLKGDDLIMVRYYLAYLSLTMMYANTLSDKRGPT